MSAISYFSRNAIFHWLSLYRTTTIHNVQLYRHDEPLTIQRILFTALRASHAFSTAAANTGKENECRLNFHIYRFNVAISFLNKSQEISFYFHRSCRQMP